MIEMSFSIIVVILVGYSLIRSSGIITGKKQIGFFGYYTNLSNILVCIYFVLLLINNLFNIWGFVRNSIVGFSVTMSITTTFLIYHFLLFKADCKAYDEKKITWNPRGIINLSLHYIGPLLTILYWLTCGDKNSLKLFQSLYWLIIPVIYIFYCLLRAKLGFTFDGKNLKWPYDFINFDKYGVKKVLSNTVLLFVVFACIGLLMAYIGIILG